MARNKSDPSEATTVVNIADFQRTRDSVIVALATLQSSVQDLSRAYINHANTVLNPGRTGTLDLGLASTLLENGLLGNNRAPQEAGAAEEAGGETKKKRKRAKHDPNAPKRALTPYFLYMQSARGQIARELGPNAKPKEVADEGTRRWGDMKEDDKGIWNDEYQKNLAIYRVKTAAYKAGQPVPDDKEAQRLVEAGKAPAPSAIEPEIEVPSDEEEEEEEESSPEPVKEPTPPKSNKRRKTGEKPATPVKETPKPAAKPSPEKKTKKAASKKEPTPPPPAAKAGVNKKKTKKA